MDQHIELFDVFSLKLIRKIQTNSPFQFLIPTVPIDYLLDYSSEIVQGGYIGYNSGTMLKCSVAALNPSLMSDNYLTEANLAVLDKFIDK